MVEKIKNLGFKIVTTGAVSTDSYSSSAQTVYRFEKDNLFIAIGLMGKIHQEMTIGTTDKLFYRQAMKVLSEEELKYLVDEISKGNNVMEMKFEDYV